MSRVLTRNARAVPTPQRFAARTRARRWRTAGWVIAVVVLIGAIAGAAWAVAWSSLFDIRTIEVRGTSNLSADEVLTAAQVPRGVPLIHADTDEIAQRVEALLLVADAQVSRHWPNTLRIEITERTTAAVVADGERCVRTARRHWRALRHRGRATGRLSTHRCGDRGRRGGRCGNRDGRPHRCSRAAARSGRAHRGDPRAHAGLRHCGSRRRRRRGVGGAEESARKAAVLTVLMQQPAQIYDVSTPEMPTTSDNTA